MATRAVKRSDLAEPVERPFAYMALYRANPIDRVEVIKSGVSARLTKKFATVFDLDQKVMFDALNLKTATVNKKAANNQDLSVDDGERVIGLAKLVGQVEAMVEDAGESAGFDAPEWLSIWLREPLPALGGVKPIDLLDTIEGQALLSRTLSQIQSATFA